MVNAILFNGHSGCRGDEQTGRRRAKQLSCQSAGRSRNIPSSISACRHRLEPRQAGDRRHRHPVELTWRRKQDTASPARAGGGGGVC